MVAALQARVSPGQKSRGRGPGGGAGNTRPAGGRTTRKARGGVRRVQGATRKVVRDSRQPRPGVSAWINRLLILLAAGIVLMVATRAYVTLQAIPVQRITVTGDLAHTRREAVQEVVQPALAGGFLRANLQGIRTQLETLPWIYRVDVRRMWPAALEIHVTEQLPIARWGENGFLNHEGEIFRPSHSAEWQDLPLLRGPEGTARSLMATYRRMVDMLSPLGMAIEQLAVDQRGQVTAVLVGGIRVVLGAEDFLPRMQRFVELYRRELASRAADVASVDLRYRSGAAVTFTEPAQVAGL